MKQIISKYIPEMIGLILGAIAGWCYWRFMGCASGNCAITSHPLNSSLYGAVMGVLAAGILKKEKEIPIDNKKACTKWQNCRKC